MWRGIFVVFAKEVVDNIRDRRSLMVAFIYPLLGPLILGVIISMVSNVVRVNPERHVQLPVVGAEHAPQLMAFLKNKGVNVVPAPADAKAAVRAGKANNILVVPENFTAQFGAKKTASVDLIVNSSRLPGLIALNRTLGWLGEYNQIVWGKRISTHGVDFQKLRPLTIKNVNVSSGTHIAEVLLFMVPPLFIFNLFMGGVYLAMDTTSGERERDSLEPLLINPIERWGLMLGKFLAALLFTAAAVAVQLFAFQIAFKLAGVGSFSFVHNLNALTIVGIMLMTLPLMIAAVGIQFVVATVTTSFKEAQTYLGLLPLVPAIPGMALVFSPVQVQDWMMAIPSFSQTLLLGQMVRGESITLSAVAISMATTTLLAGGLLWVVAKLYEREELIFGG